MYDDLPIPSSLQALISIGPTSIGSSGFVGSNSISTLVPGVFGFMGVSGTPSIGSSYNHVIFNIDVHSKVTSLKYVYIRLGSIYTQYN